VAELLDVSKGTVYRLIHQCALPAFQLNTGGSLRILEVDLEGWLASRRNAEDE